MMHGNVEKSVIGIERGKMFTISRKAFAIWGIFLISLLVVAGFLKLDGYLYIYCLFLFIFASWCILAMKKVVNVLVVFSVFYTILYGIAPLILYYNSRDYYILIGKYVAISYLCFLAGYFCDRRKLFKNECNVRNLFGEYDSKMLVRLCILLFSVGILAYLLYFFKNGNLIFGNDLENGRVEAMTGNGVLLWCGKLAWLATFIIYEQKLITKCHKLICIIMISIVSVLSIFLGFRSVLVDAILILFFMRNKEKEISIKKMLLISVLLFVFVGIYGAVRGGGGTVAGSLLNEFKVSSVNLNYILESFPDRIPFQRGKTYTFDFRALVYDDVPGMTMWLKEKLKLSFSGGGVTPGIIGEWYINWGNFGVVGGMFLSGIIAKGMDKVYRDQNNSIFVSSLLMGYIRSIIRGGVGNCMIVLLVYVIGYYGCLYITKRISVKI